MTTEGAAMSEDEEAPTAENDAADRVPLTCRVFGHNWEQTRDSATGPWLFRCPKCRATTPIPPAVCGCPEGPHIGTQRFGEPVSCERCGCLIPPTRLHQRRPAIPDQEGPHD